MANLRRNSPIPNSKHRPIRHRSRVIIISSLILSRRRIRRRAMRSLIRNSRRILIHLSSSNSNHRATGIRDDGIRMRRSASG